ncbi:hypothetical protein [Bacillus marasmi]|nr:hypothetical protein [Bacillus marasmi]
MQNIDSEKLYVSTFSGDIVLEKVVGPITTIPVNGDIKVINK